MSSGEWVVNASPVISLARIGCVGWLENLADSIVMPMEVAGEILAGPDDEARRLVQAGAIEQVETPDADAELLGWGVGAGETAVIAYAVKHHGWTAVLDDGAARKCARSMGVPVLGVISIVIAACRAGLTDEAVPHIAKLRANGFRIADDVIQAALAGTTGESWPPAR